ncbi:MAG: nonstructural protein [Arizlama microvirus]|nr:MAG: nonstructural protein [Arizlama microvirus]
MIQYICTVKDRAADAFGRPMFVPSTGVAIRSFSDEINRNNVDNQLYNHPDDFDLYELGQFDDNTGLFVLHDQPKLLSLGKQVKIS